MNPRAFRTHRVLPAILVAAIAGCATPLDPPTAPAVSSDAHAPLASSAGSGSGGAWLGLSGTFYPLQLGNHWRYRRQVVYTLIPDVGDPSPPYEESATIDRELVCVAQRDGRDYMVEQTDEQGPNRSAPTWIHYRQDRTGLYEADVAIQDPPSCVAPLVAAPSTGRGDASARLERRMDALIPAGPPARQAAFRAAVVRLGEKLALVEAALGAVTGASPQPTGAQLVQPGEITRLRYPLYAGARWIIRNDPGATFVATVEGADVLPLPAGRLRGHRIRITFDSLGPDDRVRVWYGTSGFLQLALHAEYQAVDMLGQPQGRVIVDQRETLEELSLSGPVLVWPPTGGWPPGR